VIGKTISHYKILEKLGEGGMGVVYKAEDTKLKREVAIKFLPRQIAFSDEERERFRLEAQAAAALSHSNIATIYEIDEVDGEEIIVMEIIKGVNLKERISTGPLELDEVMRIASEVADGLQEAHEHKIVHRDIKPANIMLTAKGQCKIMDFGLAKMAQATLLTKEGTTLGTAAYMSPEQTRGETVDPRADIWSLGVVVYEMITGQRPFKGDYESAVVYSILHEEPEPITALRSGVPMQLERIANKCLAKSPDDRYQHADELLVDLRQCVKLTDDVRTSRAPSARSKKPLLIGVPLAVFAALVIMYFSNIFRSGTLGTSAQKIRLAVLPFDNISPDPNDAYFADGMTEAMILKLSKIKDLTVIARSSVIRYKGKSKGAAEIGSELNVSKLLEGSVRKAGDLLRISVQLVDVETQAPTWSEEYDRELLDVFAIQDEISLKVANQLKVELLETEREGIAKRYTENLEAYSLYLKGRYSWNRRSPAALQQALDFFHQALEKDPKYALAYTGIADTYVLFGAAPFDILPPREALPKARTAVLRALEIDDTVAEAHASFGLVSLHEWRWTDAENAFQKAIALNPNYASAHHWYSILLRSLGRNSEAESYLRRSLEVDPLSLIINFNLAAQSYRQGHLERAVSEIKKVLAMEPNFGTANLWLGIFYAQQKKYEQAIAAAEKAQMIAPKSKMASAALGYVYAVSGRRRLAMELIEEFQELGKNQYVPPFLIAWVHVGLGNQDEAFHWLEKALKEKDDYLQLLLPIEPTFEPIRSDPRYFGLLKRMGLAQ